MMEKTSKRLFRANRMLLIMMEKDVKTAIRATIWWRRQRSFGNNERYDNDRAIQVHTIPKAIIAKVATAFTARRNRLNTKNNMWI